jgi:hypothetical protein
MERPAKRLRVDRLVCNGDDHEDELFLDPDELNARRDPAVQLQQSRALAAFKLKSSWELIFEKYGKDFTGVGDEIDLATEEVVVDNGHLRSMQDAKGAIATSEAGSADDEERILHGKRNGSLSASSGALVPSSAFTDRLSFLSSPPRLSSMMLPSRPSFSTFPMVFESLQLHSKASDPTWQAPELPESAFSSRPRSASGSKVKKVAMKLLPGLGWNDEVNEDDILLGKASSNVSAIPTEIQDSEAEESEDEGFSIAAAKKRTAQQNHSPQARGQGDRASLGRHKREGHGHKGLVGSIMHRQGLTGPLSPPKIVQQSSSPHPSTKSKLASNIPAVVDQSGGSSPNQQNRSPLSNTRERNNANTRRRRRDRKNPGDEVPVTSELRTRTSHGSQELVPFVNISWPDRRAPNKLDGEDLSMALVLRNKNTPAVPKVDRRRQLKVKVIQSSPDSTSAAQHTREEIPGTQNSIARKGVRDIRPLPHRPTYRRNTVDPSYLFSDDDELPLSSKGAGKISEVDGRKSLKRRRGRPPKNPWKNIASAEDSSFIRAALRAAARDVTTRRLGEGDRMDQDTEAGLSSSVARITDVGSPSRRTTTQDKPRQSLPSPRIIEITSPSREPGSAGRNKPTPTTPPSRERPADAGPKSSKSASRTGLISLVSDGEEDELSLCSSIFSSPPAAVTVELVPKRKITLLSSHVAKSSPIVSKTPFTPTVSRITKLANSSPPRLELVRTPGGTLRRCGERGFTCGKDFCFTCG